MTMAKSETIDETESYDADAVLDLDLSLVQERKLLEGPFLFQWVTHETKSGPSVRGGYLAIKAELDAIEPVGEDAEARLEAYNGTLPRRIKVTYWLTEDRDQARFKNIAAAFGVNPNQK